MASVQPKSAETTVKRTARAIERQSRDVADSAAETQQSAARIETSADLNTRLAADRNILADQAYNAFSAFPEDALAPRRHAHERAPVHGAAFRQAAGVFQGRG